MESATKPASWQELIAAHDPVTGFPVRFSVVYRLGEPLLVVGPNTPIKAALSLYAAQTPLARLARALWRWLLPIGLGPGLEHALVRIDPAAPIIHFLRGLSGDKPPALPPLAILAGNPREPARRFLILIFSRGKPVSVVKVGIRPEAIHLINRELAFLTSVSPGMASLPQVKAQFETPNLRAFATGYFPGESPQAADLPRIRHILEQWLDSASTCSLAQLEPWQKLKLVADSDPAFQSIAPGLEARRVSRAVYHGDFAPWNIKLSPHGSLTVLDWDRGLRQGVPGWDWFHYLLQPAILVQRKPPRELLSIALNTLNDPWFRQYCANAGLAGVEREWLQAYLLHCHHVLRPAEGSPKIPELLALLRSAVTDRPSCLGCRH